MKIRKLWISVLVAVIVAGFFGYLILEPGRPTAGGEQVASREDGASSVAPVQAVDDAPTAERQDGVAPGPERRQARPAVLEVIGDTYRFDPTNPTNESKSLADADWLHRNGFLDPQAHDHLMRSTIDELEAAAKLDLRAAVILAYRMAVAGSYGEQPFVILQNAAAQGSTFALVTWGDIHQAIPMYRNPAIGSAYYTLALRRGYFSAAVKKNILAARLTPEEGLYSDVYAEAAWLRLADERVRLGKPPFSTADMRPGFEAFLAAIEASFRAGVSETPSNQQ